MNRVINEKIVDKDAIDFVRFTASAKHFMIKRLSF